MGAADCGVLDNCISTTLRFEYDLAFMRISVNLLPSSNKVLNFQCHESILRKPVQLPSGQEVVHSKSGLRFSVIQKKRDTSYSIEYSLAATD